MQDAELLLESTSGKIGRVILIKLEPLAKGDTEIKNGFAEVWKYDASTGRMKMVGIISCLFPFSENNFFIRIYFPTEAAASG